MQLLRKMIQNKHKFTDKLKYGACGGRKQIHPKANLHPMDCTNENAGTAPMPCSYNPHKAASGPCNCCDACRFNCYQMEVIRLQNGGTAEITVKKIKELMEKHSAVS